MAAIPAQNPTTRTELTLYTIGSAEVRWSVQYNAYVVYWFGDHQHGGCHYDRDDAYQHAVRLATAEPWDLAEWLVDSALAAEYQAFLERGGFGAPAAAVAQMMEV